MKNASFPGQSMKKTAKVPVYKQIYQSLRQEILDQVYSSDNRLPSENELCRRFDVERNTVRKALQLLVDEKMVVRVPGCGTKILDPSQVPEEKSRGNAQAILLITQHDYLQHKDVEYFHFKLIQKIEHYFSDLGFNLIFKSIQNVEELKTAVDGASPAAIVFDSYMQESIYRAAVTLGIPCISVNHYTDQMTSIVSDNYGAAYRVAKMLTEAGHRRIALITGKENYQTNIERLKGFRIGYADQGLDPDQLYLFAGDWKFESGAAAAEKILSLPADSRPTAVFAFNDDMAFGCMNYLQSHGISIPKEISLVGFDKTDRYEQIFPAITTVDVNMDALVEYACWYLSGCMATSAPTTSARINILTTLVDNGTLCAPKQD